MKHAMQKGRAGSYAPRPLIVYRNYLMVTFTGLEVEAPSVPLPL